MGGSLAGAVAVVTGATRGIGRGCALELAAAGATVYATGRTLAEGGAALPGSLESTASEIERLGGRCVPVPCDHADDGAHGRGRDAPRRPRLAPPRVSGGALQGIRD